MVLQLDRVDLADIHHPAVLARTIHKLMGKPGGAVPVNDIAVALDIMEVRLDLYDGFEGILLTDTVRSTGCILANNSKGHRRARFTIAHELGHFLMERHELSGATGFTYSAQDMRKTRDGRRHLRQETQANQFAIELLAPDYLIEPFFSDDPDLRDAQRLGDHLDVSVEACVRRMVDLGRVRAKASKSPGFEILAAPHRQLTAEHARQDRPCCRSPGLVSGKISVGGGNPAPDLRLTIRAAGPEGHPRGLAHPKQRTGRR